MTAPHDTPEAVEAMAENVLSVHWGAITRAAAAMLRRLHERAVDAERERDIAMQELALCQMACFDANASHADALREALEAVKGIDTADIYSTGERHAAEEIRGFAMFLIGKLIEQPTTGET